MIFDISDILWFFSTQVFTLFWQSGVCIWIYFTWKMPVFRYGGILLFVIGLWGLIYSFIDFQSHKSDLKNSNFKEIVGIPIKESTTTHRIFVFSINKVYFRCFNYSSMPHIDSEICAKVVSKKEAVRIQYLPNQLHGHGEDNIILKVEIVRERT